MTLYEILLEVKHDCQLGVFSQRYSSMRVFVWFFLNYTLVELITNNTKKQLEILKDASRLGEVKEIVSNEMMIHLVVKTFPSIMDGYIEHTIDSLGLVRILPVMIDNGWGTYHVIAINHNDVKSVVNQLKAKGYLTRIIRKNMFDGSIAEIQMGTFISQLTKKQVDALLTAYYYGYYELPRKSSVQTIAASRNIPRSTFQEHLKKAENKIVTALVPIIHALRSP